MKRKLTHKGSRKLGWPSAGMVIGCLALLVAVGGTGSAASRSGSQDASAASSSNPLGSSPQAAVARRGRRGPRGRQGPAGPRGPAGPAGATGARGAPGVEAAADPIVGSWTVTVNRPGLPSVSSLQTYTKGRGVVESGNSGATARSTSHGAWRRVAAHRYEATMVFFRYDPTNGAYLGTVKLRRVLEFAPGNQSFTGVSVGELRDPAGNLLPGSNVRRDTETGVRINVEPIPAQP